MREEALSVPDLYSNVRMLSRHALEVEQSLLKGSPKGSGLSHLVQPRLQGMKDGSSSLVSCIALNIREFEGLFTWREEDPSTRKILEGETNFRLVYGQKFGSESLTSGEGKEKKLSAFSS